MTVRETVDAKKQRYGEGDLDAVFAGASKVVVAKGKKVVTFAPAGADFDAAAFAKAVIGPSGNLRAPAIRCGKTWLVGFHDEAYGERFGG
ncbi:MAG: hypothetical protein KDC98_25380 [Planctomycetes bacterium]|nr:hypothetical protein [Planctomycetota bacterium]